MPPTTPYRHNARTLGRLAMWVISICVVITLGLWAHYITSFHIVRTDPGLNAVSANSPFLRLYLSQNIQENSLHLSDPDSIVASQVVKGKTITLSLRSSLKVGTQYNLIINSVSSAKGTTIHNKVLRFTTRDIPVSKLSKEAQAAVMKQTDNYPYSVYRINFESFDELTNSGLTAEQELAVKQAIYDYSTSVNQQFNTVSLITSSIYPGPFDPNSTDPSRSLGFSFLADNTKYSVTATYSDLTTVHVVISDVTGTTVFDNRNH